MPTYMQPRRYRHTLEHTHSHRPAHISRCPRCVPIFHMSLSHGFLFSVTSPSSFFVVRRQSSLSMSLVVGCRCRRRCLSVLSAGLCAYVYVNVKNVCVSADAYVCKYVCMGYTYKNSVHALHCTNKHGRFGGPLCAEPYGVEAQSTVKTLQADSGDDTRLALNNFTEHCPELTEKQMHTMHGFDCAVKTIKVPFGPLLWPTGLKKPTVKCQVGQR